MLLKEEEIMLKKFKKSLALGLALLMLTVTACSNGGEQLETTTDAAVKEVEKTTEASTEASIEETTKESTSESTMETTTGEDVALVDTSNSFYVRGDKLISEKDIKENDIVIEDLSDASCSACVGLKSNIKKFAYDELNEKYNNLVWKYSYISFLDGNSSNIKHRSNIVPAVLMELNKSYPEFVVAFNDKIMDAKKVNELYNDESLEIPEEDLKDVTITKKIFLEIEGTTEEIWNKIYKEAPKYILAIDRATDKAIADDSYYEQKLEEGKTLSTPAFIVGNNTNTIDIKEVAERDITMFDAISEKIEEEIAARANK